MIVACRLLANKQAEQQDVYTKEARSKQVKLQQQRQQHATKRFQASQEGPGDLRPAGQRYRLQTRPAVLVDKLSLQYAGTLLCCTCPAITPDCHMLHTLHIMHVQCILLLLLMWRALLPHGSPS